MMFWLAWFFGITTLLAILFIIYAPVFLKWVPFSVEKNFVKPYEEIADHFWGEDSHPEIEAYLQNLTNELAVAIDLPEEIEIQTHFIESDEINAFATLGGHIIITRGLLEAVDNENSLAMVIAHELAHQKHRDPITGLSRGIALQMLYSLISSDRSQIDLSGFGGELGLLYFSREQEQNADEAAIYALNNYYGHVGGYDQFFQAVLEIEAPEEASLPQWLSSHPDTLKRIEYLQELEEENGWEQNLTHPIPEQLLQPLEAEQPQ